MDLQDFTQSSIGQDRSQLSSTAQVPKEPTEVEGTTTASRNSSTECPTTPTSSSPTRAPGKPSVRVSITTDINGQGASETPKRKEMSATRREMEKQLAAMQTADDNQRLREKAARRKAVDKAIAAMYKAKAKEGVTLTQDVEGSRTAIRTMMREEERMALAKDQKILREGNKALQQEIDRKYGLKDKKQRHDLMALTERFHKDKVKNKDGIPEHVLRELTKEEIEDLRMVFDMFDMKGRGFITATDVRRAASMLGFKAKKEIFTGMIEEVTGDRLGRVTFAHFLQFVVMGQGDGDDQLDAILQCFRLLDRGQKGYVTADDLRNAADTQKVPLSNRAIREMIQEADVTGDAKVTSDEFIHIMLQCSMFRATR